MYMYITSCKPETACTCTYIHTYIRTCMHGRHFRIVSATYVHVHVYICIYIHVYMYIHNYNVVFNREACKHVLIHWGSRFFPFPSPYLNLNPCISFHYHTYTTCIHVCTCTCKPETACTCTHMYYK